MAGTCDEQVGNIELGVPIRVIRKNKDASSEYSNIFIYDGLYDVVRLLVHLPLNT